MAMSSSNLTFISLFSGTDVQGKMVLASHSQISSHTCWSQLGLCLVLWFLQKNAIRAISLGTRSTRSLRSQLGIKTADPISLITRRDEGTWAGDKSSSCGLIGSLDEIVCMIQKKEKKKVKVKRIKKTPTTFWFPLHPSYFCGRLPFSCFEGEC